MTQKIKIGIVGGTGYTGVELLRILAAHPHAELKVITSRGEAGTPVAKMFPSLRGRVDLVFQAPDEATLKACDVVFFATPHGVAMAQAPALVAAGVKVIDFAGDFRFQNVDTFTAWYKMPHTCPELLAEAAYGLVELNREAIQKARIVGNSGCYPITVQLGFAPLLRAQWVEPKSLIANSASGVSGAGRKAEVGTLFAEAADNFKAYGTAFKTELGEGHRHAPEINDQLRKIDPAVNVQFVPHLLPMIRGIHSTLYARLNAAGQAKTQAELQALFEQAYANEPFVDVLPAGSEPDTRSVRGSNTVRIAVHKPQPDLALILVVEDNLCKGASGQAVQCMNLMFGLPETTGLQHLPLLP